MLSQSQAPCEWLVSSDASKHVTFAVPMQNDAGIMTRVSSFPFEGVNHPASSFPPPPNPPPPTSTPFDWGSPRATAGATSQNNADLVISEAAGEAPCHSAGVGGYASGRFSGVTSGNDRAVG